MNIKKLIRDVKEEEIVRMLKIIMENNTKILELQKTLIILIKWEEKEKKKRVEEERRREYDER